MENNTNISPPIESIDFNKLKIILKSNWYWIVLIFLLINISTSLYLRYTKNLYESESQLRLDIKSEVSELNIEGITSDPTINILSGEIEMIQSKLFLNRVLDFSNFTTSFYSVGRVLNDELFRNEPVHVVIHKKNHSYYDTPIGFEEVSDKEYILTIGAPKQEVHGFYNKKLIIGNLEITLVQNPNFAKGDEVGYFFVINSREALLGYLSARLTAEPINFNANTIRVAFKDHHPLKAKTILDKIDTLYLQYSNEQKNLANTQKIEWLSNQLRQIEKKMEDYENYFENFTLQNKTSNLDEDIKSTIIGLNKIDSQRYEAERRQIELIKLNESLKAGQLNASVYLIRSLPTTIVSRLESLQKLQLEQERLKLSYKESTFAYQQKEKNIQLVKNEVVEQLAAIKKDWDRKINELDQRKRKLESEFVNLPDKSTQFTKNQRFYKLYEEFYFALMQSRSQFEIAQAGTTPDFKILAPASMPSGPISPKRFMVTGVGLVASMMAIFFLIGILYLLNNKITSLNELERVAAVPVLGAIPMSRYKTNGLHITEHPKSMVSEAMRTLRTNLEFFIPSKSKKVIAISSTVSGEGKSFVAMNLGGIIAMSKKKVVLIDLDMRKPKNSYPATPEDLTKGISTILIRKNTWRECIIKTDQDDFDFISSGPHPPNPSELLLNGDFGNLLEDMKNHYDFILLDTPPVGLVTDGIMAMKKADLSIYVLRANYSKRDFLSNLQRIISINKFTNIATVLNSVPTEGKTYGYGYYEENSNGKIGSLFKS